MPLCCCAALKTHLTDVLFEFGDMSTLRGARLYTYVSKLLIIYNQTNIGIRTSLKSSLAT